MEINKVTEIIIKCAIEVHKTLGPGLLESVYEECLCLELSKLNIDFERQKELGILYKGHRINNKFRVDLIVNDSVIIELKHVDKINPIHKAQLITYLKLANKKVGLIINFNETLLKNGITRLVF